MKKCQMPEQVDVLGKRFAVKFKKLTGKCGTCDYDNTAITLNPSQSREAMADTVLHEILHAIDKSMKCGMNEAQVTRMATGALQVLRANPVLVKYLTE